MCSADPFPLVEGLITSYFTGAAAKTLVRLWKAWAKGISEADQTQFFGFLAKVFSGKLPLLLMVVLCRDLSPICGAIAMGTSNW